MNLVIVIVNSVGVGVSVGVVGKWKILDPSHSHPSY